MDGATSLRRFISAGSSTRCVLSVMQLRKVHASRQHVAEVRPRIHATQQPSGARMNPSTLHEPARETPVFSSFDVVVLGGGPAGIAAAAAAGQAGSSTLLVEHYGFLGGMGTAAGVTNFCGLHANVYGTIRQVVHGVADQLLQRMHALGALKEPHVIFGGKIAAQAYDNAAFKVAADGLVIDSGAQL